MSDAAGSERVTIALAGCGVVGEALTGLISGLDAARSPGGPRLSLERILVRCLDKPRPPHLSAALFTTDPTNFARSGADVVVEAMGGTDVPLQLARSALARGASYVTANKALIARHGAELERLALQGGGCLLFEGAVAGGVPVLRAIESSFSGVTIRSLTGILNGTCNFVLTEMEEGAPFHEALGRARRAGYAEADATRDLDGRDAADKIAILAWRAWGIDPAAVRVRRRGILPDPTAWIRAARAEGSTVRLLACCRRTGRGVRAWVAPVRVEHNSAFAAVRGVQNLLQVRTDGSGTYSLSGPGAGGRATASAVLADILSLTRGVRPGRYVRGRPTVPPGVLPVGCPGAPTGDPAGAPATPSTR